MIDIKKELGIGLIVIGLGFSFMNKSITGAVIGSVNTNFFGIVGVLIFIVGLMLTYRGARENIEYMERESELKDMLGERYGHLNERERLQYNKSIRRNEEKQMKGIEGYLNKEDIKKK